RGIRSLLVCRHGAHRDLRSFPTRRSSDLYRLAAGAHKGQLRRSGEPYITHPLAVAGIVARYGMDDVTIAAALLHDAVEDTVLTLDRKSTRLNSSHVKISYAVFCLKKKTKK